MSDKMRIELERRIAKAAIDQALANGFELAVFDGEGKACDYTSDSMSSPLAVSSRLHREAQELAAYKARVIVSIRLNWEGARVLAANATTQEEAAIWGSHAAHCLKILCKLGASV